jgi:hypothetical protein
MSVSGGTQFQVAPVCNSPFKIMIRPNIACASTSSATGPSLSLSTAGIQGSFLIFARDAYSNDRSSQPDDSYIVRIRQYTGASFTNIECALSPTLCYDWNTYNSNAVTLGGRDKIGAIKRVPSGYLASYNVTRSGINYVWATLAVVGGLQATYYGGDSAFGSPPARRINTVDSTVDFSASGNFLGGAQNHGTFSARWTGIIVPPVSGVYTFSTLNAISSTRIDRVKLWVI